MLSFLLATYVLFALLFALTTQADAAALPQGGDSTAPAAERAAAPAAPTDVLFSELTKLNELREKGLITDEEYQAQKRKILARSN